MVDGRVFHKTGAALLNARAVHTSLSLSQTTQCHNKPPRPYLMTGDLLVARGVTYRCHKQHNVTINHRDHTWWLVTSLWPVVSRITVTNNMTINHRDRAWWLATSLWPVVSRITVTNNMTKNHRDHTWWLATSLWPVVSRIAVTNNTMSQYSPQRYNFKHKVHFLVKKIG